MNQHSDNRDRVENASTVYECGCGYDPRCPRCDGTGSIEIAPSATITVDQAIEAAEADDINHGGVIGITVGRTLAAEVRSLRAIVDRLPITADGVPVVPGDRLWGISRGFVYETYPVESLVLAEPGGLKTVENFYHTREAAVASLLGGAS